MYHYDAFANIPNKGNPAGVVINGDNLKTDEMQLVASKVGFNETAFLMKSEVADFRIRYFTPGNEMELCGHGTISMIYALEKMRLLEQKKYFKIETLAGILNIIVDKDESGRVFISMEQGLPKFTEYNGSISELAQSIGIQKNEIDHELPIIYGSTGNWTLIVPIKSLATFNRMKPNNQIFPSILREIPNASIHPFCLETINAKNDIHARHFSSPFSATIEDPVTGTASGVLGVYYMKHINNSGSEVAEISVEQGTEINKEGIVKVKIEMDGVNYKVQIAGQAIYVESFEINI